MKKTVGISLLTLLILMVLTANALAVRCGNDIISEGATMEQVLANCGEPFRKTNWLEHKDGTTRADKLHTGVDVHWIFYYDFHDGYTTIMMFRDGILINIDAVQNQNFD